MSFFNQTIISGRLTDDPKSNMNRTAASFSVAVSPYKKDSNEPQLYMNVNVFQQFVPFVMDTFRKGSPVCVVGRLVSHEWESKGMRQRRVEINANSVWQEPLPQKQQQAPQQGGYPQQNQHYQQKQNGYQQQQGYHNPRINEEDQDIQF